MLPQGQPLQQQPFSRLGTLGANQLRRHLCQLPAAAEPGHHQHTACVAAHNDRAQWPLEGQLHPGGKVVHNVVALPNGAWENDGPRRHPQEAPQEGSTAGIGQILRRNGAAAIPQRLHHANLRPLLVHHFAHGGDAHQGRHQEEKQGKHLADPLHNVRITFIADIGHIGIPVQEISVRL